MRKLQIGLLLSAAVCYALTLLFFIRLDLAAWLFFFILHSILAIAGCFACLKAQEEHLAEIERLEEDLKFAETDKKQAVDAVNEELSTTKRALEAVEKEKLITLQENNMLEGEIASLKRIVAEQEEQSKTFSEKTAILPIHPDEREKKRTVNIIGIANEVAKQLKEAATEAGVVIRVSSSEDAFLVKADPAMLRTLFLNIYDNSIKYMKRHGSLVVTISHIEDDLFVVCKDNGEGLPPDETSHIFELNYQGSNRISGNGLGLAQARAIVEYYGGTIYAKSMPGNGMGIYIQMPTT